MDLGAPEELLAGLDAAQRAAVESTAAPLCVLAGAGSGKTRVLTRRVAWRVARGDAHGAHVLVLTFTRKAAGELSQRLYGLGLRDRVAAGTFHSVAYAQLRTRWADRDEAAPTLIQSKVRLLGRILAARTPGGSGHRWAEAQPADIAGEIEWAKARMVGPAEYVSEAEGAGRRAPGGLALSTVASLYERYEEEKRRARQVDFEDLLELCALAMETDPAFAAAQRWRFRHLFVDEFQDVNPAQFRLLTAWLGERTDLFVVGDPRQAIYSWNGADPTLLTGFTTRFPGAEVVELDQNYRSAPQILRVAGAVLGRAAGADLQANRPDGPVPRVFSYGSDADEARAVAGLVRRAQRPGGRWGDIAVLARTNAQIPALERALRAAQVPHRVAGGAAFLDQAEVKQALAELAAAPPGQTLASALAELGRAAEDPDLPGLGSGELDLGPAAPDDRRANVLELVELGREYAAMDPDPSLRGFRSWLVATLVGDRPGGGTAGQDAVFLGTFHKAKGLEWHSVFLVGLERGLVPIARAGAAADEAEERRLLYVAVTRAAEQLTCTWAERRSFGARPVPRSPSPYLEAIEMACEELQGVVASPDRRRRNLDGVRTSRARLAPASGGQSEADPVLMTALRKWRAATAKASGVPAYVIFHDSTLTALALARPRTTEALLRTPGLGPVKASRYGADLLALLAELPAV